MNSTPPPRLPPRTPPLLSAAEKISESVAHSVIYKMLVPLVLLPIFTSGSLLPVLFTDEWRKAKGGELVMLAVMAGVSVLGTVSTIMAIRFLRARPAGWQLFALGRAAWITLLATSWLAGVGCALLTFVA